MGSKKIIYFLWVLLLPLMSHAQLDNQPVNLPKYDYQKVHFGFAIGFNSADFVIKKIPQFNVIDSVYGIEGSAIAGLNLTILSNLRIGNYFDLRFLPTLSFQQRNLDYSIMFDSLALVKTKKVES